MRGNVARRAATGASDAASLDVMPGRFRADSVARRRCVFMRLLYSSGTRANARLSFTLKAPFTVSDRLNRESLEAAGDESHGAIRDPPNDKVVQEIS